MTTAKITQDLLARMTMEIVVMTTCASIYLGGASRMNSMIIIITQALVRATAEKFIGLPFINYRQTSEIVCCSQTSSSSIFRL